jgi:hypothetical protein
MAFLSREDMSPAEAPIAGISAASNAGAVGCGCRKQNQEETPPCPRRGLEPVRKRSVKT